MTRCISEIFKAYMLTVIHVVGKRWVIIHSKWATDSTRNGSYLREDSLEYLSF